MTEPGFEGRKLLLTALILGVTTAVGYALYLCRKKARPAPIALDPKQKIPFKLIEKEEVSHDTRRFRFALQSPEHVLGLPTGRHIFLSAHINGRLVVRPYTPVTSDDDIGYFDLIIKVYFKNVHPKFPDGGKMSQHLNSLKIGEAIDVRGPGGFLTYIGDGVFEVAEVKKPKKMMSCKKVGLIAGGTGITPMLQIIRAIIKVESDDTHISLLYANQTEEDILLRNELEQVQKENPNQVSLWYTLDRPTDDWPYSSGFVNEKMIADHLPGSNEDSVILMCGPPPMITYACLPNLKKLGFSEDRYCAFK